MRVLGAALVATLVLAGCADGPPDSVHRVAQMDPAPFAAIVQDREVLAGVAIKETPTPGARDTLDLTSQERPPHTGQFTYHGLGMVHNEWGRQLPAHVFRYNAMAFVVTDIQIDIQTGHIDIDGEYREIPYEYAFDAADGRFMGYTDLERGVRSFVEPGYRLPYGPGYPGNLMLRMVAYMHGELTAPVSYEFGPYNVTTWMEAYDGPRPLPGACDMYLERSKVTGPGIEPPVDKPNPDPYRSIACFDGAMVPLWHYAGNQTGGSLALERQGPGFAWAGPLGDVLPDDPFEQRPMEAIDPVLPTSDPIYTPPAGAGEDWAKAVRDRVAALHISVPYQEFELSHGAPYAHHVVAGWPAHAFPLLLGGVLGGVLQDVDPFTESTWVMVTDGPDWFWTNVHTMEIGEGSHYFVPDLNGFTFENTAFEYPAREALGDVVATDSVRGRVPEFSPVMPRFIDWMVWPDFDSDFPQPVAWWTIASHCFEAADDAHFLMFDGQRGNLLATGGMETHANGCSMGSFTAWMGGQEVTVFPSSPDRSFPVVLDAQGRLAMPLPVEALEMLRVGVHL